MKVDDFEIKEYSRRNMILTSLRITYKEFLLSPKWANTKEKLYKRDGKKCSVCFSEKKLNVHHNNYNKKNLTGGISCLVVVCSDCHTEIHRLAKMYGWYYKKAHRSIKKRFKKYGNIYK